MKIEKNERIDDLQIKYFKIIQNKDYFCFGIDSILLSDFSKDIKRGSIVADLGCGNGIIPILLCAKTEAKKIIGIEKQEESANLAIKNIKLNDLAKRIEIINDDILNISKYLKANSIDVIVSNPPYKKENTGLKNENKNKYIARHETTGKLYDFIKISSYLLKDNGKLFMVHRTERLTDIISTLRENRIEPKKIRFVFSNLNSESKMFLIEGRKNGKSFLKIDKPLIIYDENSNYTNEILNIYGKGDINK